MGEGALPTGSMSTVSNASIANPLPSGIDNCSNPANVNAATAVAGTMRQLKLTHSGFPVAAGANMASFAAAIPAAAKMYPVDSAMTQTVGTLSNRGRDRSRGAIIRTMSAVIATVIIVDLFISVVLHYRFGWVDTDDFEDLVSGLPMPVRIGRTTGTRKVLIVDS